MPDAMRALTSKGARFLPGEVTAWMDCGNRAVTVETNGRMLEFLGASAVPDSDANVEDSVIIPPCLILPGAVIKRSVVGPRVTIGPGTVVEDAILADCLVGTDSHIRGAHLSGSMIGNKSRVIRNAVDLSLGDYSETTC